MNWKNWIMAGLVLSLAAGSGSGCRFGRRGKTPDMPPAVIDEAWMIEGSRFPDGDFLGERFGYTDVLDLAFENVVFGFDSSQITATEQPKVEAVADYMRRNPAVKAIIDGHTCDIGGREYNMALGERRALAVRAYLVRLGIDSARIQTRSFGKENPLHAGTDESSRRLNRRAAFVIVR